MDRIAQLSANDRGVLFANTAAEMGVSPAIAEKDFWVCWTLKQLFTCPGLAEHLTFKGGTTLSKVYNLIYRFSEDIDLTLNRSLFCADDSDDPETATSNKERDRRIERVSQACTAYVNGHLLNMLTTRFADVLGEQDDGWHLRASTSDVDDQTLLFGYPAGVDVDSSAYVAPAVKLEFGCRGESWPTSRSSIKPYAAEQFPGAFQCPEVEVVNLTAERTFWEKATILHAEAHRPQDSQIPLRLSRHYYDLVMLARDADLCASSLADTELLARVVQHKKDFFRCGWARYDDAIPGSMALMPPESRQKALRSDYVQMQMMMFRDPPDFDQIIGELKSLESQVNG